MKILWDELLNLRLVLSYDYRLLCACSAMSLTRKYQEDDRIIRFLKRLNESFNVVKSQILLIEPLPPLNKVFALVL